MKPTLIIATGNTHKADEIRAILGTQFEYRTLQDFPGAPKVIEDASTFAGNATKKAVELAKWIVTQERTRVSIRPLTQTYVLADDSGLEVDALGGAPGVLSARFAALDKNIGGNAPDAANREKLLLVLREVPLEKRTARFRCVIALTPLLLPQPEDASPVCYADEHELQTRLFEGTCQGRIGFEERGSGGFGYDSLFLPTGYDQTFAQLGEVVKNGMSHRGRALAALKKFLI